MPTLTVRGVALRADARQTPCVIVPIVADTAAGAAAQAAALAALPAADLAELRLDPLLAAGLPAAALPQAVAAVRGALGPKPLLATLRTAAEGGTFALPAADYAAALRALLTAPAAARPDLVDIEFTQPAAPALCAAAHATGVAVLFSEHHFDGTPAADAMLRALCAMADAGADIAKLAVMPHTPAEAASLLWATAAAAAARPDTPRLTMAMGPLGAVTRVCGGAFGSCATFGTAGHASAPGQPDAAALADALRALGACL